MAGHIDGNVLAGPLSELFTFDPTTATGRCASCGDVSELAQAMVWVKPNAYIARCHVCDAMLFTLIQSHHNTRIDLSGIRILTIEG
jgi:hypothetical protein